MTSRLWVSVMALGIGGLIAGDSALWAAEHGGHEHGGTTTAPAPSATKEHGGTPAARPSAPVEPPAEAIRQTIRDYVKQVIKKDGKFTIHDDVTGTTRELALVRVHQRVGKTGPLYYSCTDMRDQQTGQVLDLDYDVKATGMRLEVVDVRIHKVNGKARYTYDNKDRRIPVRP